eukprot:Hpha_TRINITY_DN9012_c0_g2::TRINITY_DN9012_c0_g2_i1::g.142062::m.142062
MTGQEVKFGCYSWVREIYVNNTGGAVVKQCRSMQVERRVSNKTFRRELRKQDHNADFKAIVQGEFLVKFKCETGYTFHHAFEDEMNSTAEVNTTEKSTSELTIDVPAFGNMALWRLKMDIPGALQLTEKTMIMSIHEQPPGEVDIFVEVSSVDEGCPGPVSNPTPGEKYHIVHKHSGKIVHPKGGSDSPHDGTCLVWHEKDTKLGLEWMFEDGQIKHYSSGKFLHPKGGTATKGAYLCVHNGPDGDRTGMQVVTVDGLQYLQHTKSGLWVHPQGGSKNPSNGAWLILHNDDPRPGIAIELVPVQC